MIHNRRTVITAGAASAGLAALGAAGPAAAAQTIKVNTSRTTMTFDPAEVTIKKGDSVEWRNRSIVRNSITCDPAKAKKPESVMLPAGAKPFDSGMLPQDALFTQKFTVPGTYKYFCIEHETMGMTGKVIVT